MTSRLRPVTRRPRRFATHGQDRQDFLINVGFVTVVVALVVILVAAVGWSYYEQNIRPVARVGPAEIAPQLARDRLTLLDLRISREEGRLGEMRTNQEIDQATFNLRMQDLRTRSQELEFGATENLIDLIFQAQLAAQEGISVSEADIDAAVSREFSGPERRRIEVVFVEPAKLADGGSVTSAIRRQALARAQEAHAALEAGTPFATVAAQYSTHDSASSGGEYGVISQDNPLDRDFVPAVFELAEGEWTAVIAGQDGIYRIGRVAAIEARQPDPGYQDRVLARMSNERVRQLLGWEVAADRLKDTIVERELAGPTEQIHLAHIFIENTAVDEDDEEAPDEDGEIHYSEILLSPNDDPEGAEDLESTDPAWEAARVEAEGFATELRAISDVEARGERFAEIARTESDSAISSPGGGDVPFTSRDLMPDVVADALFDAQHQPGDIVGPILGETGYYVLMFHEHRGSPLQRLEQLKAELAAGAAWSELVARYSDTDEDPPGDGELGWFTREMLTGLEEEIVEKIYGLQAGQVSEPIELGTSTHIFKALDRRVRPLDPDQVLRIRDPLAGAFENWYSDKKEEAERAGVIVRTGQEPDDGGDLLPGEDDL
jgi:parvulin-like peptidyl-prolyl isomerase